MSPTKGMTASPGDIEWQCPYCDSTEPTLREIQQHITNTTTGGHEGISGKSPDEAILAIDPDSEEEVDRYEPTDVVRPQDAPIEGASMRKQVVYAWLANNRVEDPDTIADVTEADREYAVQILGQIRRGDITRDYWADDLNEELLAALEDRLDDYTSEDEDDDTDTMRTHQQPDDVKGTTDKDIIINAYALLGDDINRKEVWQALQDAGVIGSGYEYFRREYKSAVDGDITEDQIEEATTDQIQSVLESTLSQYGILAEKQDAEKATDGQDSASTTKQASMPNQSARPREDAPVSREGRVSTAEVQQVRDQIALLHEESQSLVDVDDSVGARRAEFIGEKTISLLDELLQNQSE